MKRLLSDWCRAVIVDACAGNHDTHSQYILSPARKEIANASIVVSSVGSICQGKQEDRPWHLGGFGLEFTTASV